MSSNRIGTNLSEAGIVAKPDDVVEAFATEPNEGTNTYESFWGVIRSIDGTRAVIESPDDGENTVDLTWCVNHYPAESEEAREHVSFWYGPFDDIGCETCAAEEYCPTPAKPAPCPDCGRIS